MAVTQNTYTGNGSTVLYSFSFPYLESTDIKVSLDDTLTTEYTLANATTIQFNTAPANGVAIRIYRETENENTQAMFYPGAAIRAQDLNDNFDQVLFVTQESTNTANTASTSANTALTNSTTAISTANTALSTANTASTNASAAVTTANTANTNANTALSTANSAATNATTALNTANSAASTATAASTAATAATTASANAVTTANTASTTANTAAANASTALSTANTALSTANTASTNASNALSTANTANTNATAALNAVASSLQYVLVANVAAIPASPANQLAIEVADSTGIESFNPIANKPAGFVGDSGLSVRLQYASSGSTWNWLNYFPNNSETRYLKISGGTLTGQLRADDSTSTTAPVYSFDGDTNTGIAHTGADELALVTGGTARLTIDATGNATFTDAVTLPAGSTVSGYLDTTTAASTYQTQSGMSSYLTTASASSTYAPLASPTFTGTVTIPAGASISGYLATGAIGTTVQAYDADTAKTDVAQNFTAAQRGSYVTLTDAATVAIDLSLGNHFQVTLAGNRTLGAPTNVVAGQSGVIRVVQDGTGSRTLAYNSVFKFPGGTAPTLTTTANAVDLLAFHVESATRIAVRFIGDVK